ncbi:hypothetical protein ACFQL7_19725 [Halocatena marina]|uniref:Uncharacterized protein n=1 Tax=Halocatena marina TaxID=2934937 RepID=A0ABD5YX14_9EURY
MGSGGGGDVGCRVGYTSADADDIDGEGKGRWLATAGVYLQYN